LYHCFADSFTSSSHPITEREKLKGKKSVLASCLSLIDPTNESKEKEGRWVVHLHLSLTMDSLQEVDIHLMVDRAGRPWDLDTCGDNKDTLLPILGVMDHQRLHPHRSINVEDHPWRQMIVRDMEQHIHLEDHHLLCQDLDRLVEPETLLDRLLLGLVLQDQRPMDHPREFLTVVLQLAGIKEDTILRIKPVLMGVLPTLLLVHLPCTILPMPVALHQICTEAHLLVPAVALRGLAVMLRLCNAPVPLPISWVGIAKRQDRKILILIVCTRHRVESVHLMMTMARDQQVAVEATVPKTRDGVATSAEE
jgi:hypothetical protein